MMTVFRTPNILGRMDARRKKLVWNQFVRKKLWCRMFKEKAETLWSNIQVDSTSGQGSMVTFNVQRVHGVCDACCAGCRGKLCWVQCKAALGAVQSCAGCRAKLC